MIYPYMARHCDTCSYTFVVIFVDKRDIYALFNLI